jgi:hypothetical protein
MKQHTWNYLIKWVISFEKFVTEKGESANAKYRAYGFKTATTFGGDKTGIRALKLRFGKHR